MTGIKFVDSGLTSSWTNNWSNGGSFETIMQDINEKLRINAIRLKPNYKELALTINRIIENSDELEQVRMYCLTELQRFLVRDLASKSSDIYNQYNLNPNEEGTLSTVMDLISQVLIQKFEKLVSMESIWFSHLRDSDVSFQDTDIPIWLTRAWWSLPKEKNWQELSAFVEYIWLLIIKNNYENVLKVVALTLKINPKLMKQLV